MLVWLFSAALAAPPAGVMADEADQYERAWPTLHEGPPGCWEVVGRASWAWDLGRVGHSHGNAAFIGKLVDGEWRDVLVRSLGEDRKMRSTPEVRIFPHDEQRFLPIIGRTARQDYDDNAQSLLSEVLDELGTDVTYAYSEWSDSLEGVLLHRTVPLGEQNKSTEAEMHILFPGGGVLPTRADVNFPKTFSLPGRRLVKIRDAEAKIRGQIIDGEVFPAVETLSLNAGFLGFRASGAQTIEYDTFRVCGGDVEDEILSVSP